MKIKEGDTLPDVKVFIIDKEHKEISTKEILNKDKVILFGVPGAFTPTCSAKHLPGFVKHADDIKKAGIDTIACISVNDAFVMGAWGIDQEVDDKVLMLADGSAKFATATGLTLDLTERGMGMRCQRFIMIVDDRIVTSIKIDETGKFENTSAEALLSELL